jgi:hypothetical protein
MRAGAFARTDGIAAANETERVCMIPTSRLCGARGGAIDFITRLL